MFSVDLSSPLFSGLARLLMPGCAEPAWGHFHIGAFVVTDNKRA